EEPRGRLELVQPFLDEHAVGAQVDVLALLEDLADEPADFGIDHRFAAADADDGGAAFVDGGEAFLNGQLLLDGRFVFADAATAGAGEVASVERLEHEDEGKPLLAGDLFLGDVADHRGGEAEGKTHRSLLRSEDAFRKDRNSTKPVFMPGGIYD